MSTRTKTTLGAMATLASLAVAAPMAIGTTAHADVNSGTVNVVGTVSCLGLGDNSSPTGVSITTTDGVTRNTALRTEDTDTLYSVTFPNIPKTGGTRAMATVTCKAPNGNETPFSKEIKIDRPALANQFNLTRDLG
ncbi:hypothetical protein [Streptomyces sp. P9-A2]|uniref:hypothetical protein n=1 Tax=Streptomyces sp. P9-A2 TaxID=3072284 RepID=UPI002FCC90D0